MATVLIATVSQVHFFNRYCFDSYWICFDDCYPFPKLRFRSTPKHLEPLFRTLNREKQIFMLKWLKEKSEYQNDQTYCRSSYCVFPPKAIHSSGILVSIRVHQRYDVPLKLFQYVIRPEIVLRMNSSLILRTRCPGALRDLCTS